jgi:hypothetical protein
MTFTLSQVGRKDVSGEILYPTRKHLEGAMSEIRARGTIQVTDVFGRHDVPLIAARIEGKRGKEELVVDVERGCKQMLRETASLLQGWMATRPWAKSVAILLGPPGAEIYAYVVADEDKLSLEMRQEVAGMGLSLGNRINEVVESRIIVAEPDNCDILVKRRREVLR